MYPYVVFPGVKLQTHTHIYIYMITSRVMGISRAYHERITSVSRAYHGRITGVSRAYHERITGVSRAYHERITGVSLSYCNLQHHNMTWWTHCISIMLTTTRVSWVILILAICSWCYYQVWNFRYGNTHPYVFDWTNCGHVLNMKYDRLIWLLKS